LIKLESCIKGFLLRKNFNEYSENLKKNNNNYIKIIFTKYNSSNLAKAEEHRPVPYNKEGWKQFYYECSEKFKKNYGKRFFTNLLVINDEEIYIGEINYEYKKHGYGYSIYKNGCKFTGFWWESYFEGWGEYIDIDANIFHGLFVNGKLNGKGFKFSSNGNRYEGDFVGGLRCGVGREETKDHVYNGHFERDKKNKKGKLVYKNNKDWYEGEFLNNNITGKGQYFWENGDIFIGDFINGKMHGKGLYKWPDGGQYEGDYVDNIKEGKGEFKWANGKIFIGPFVNGKPHGKGILKANVGIIEVDFIDGKLKKQTNKKDVNSNEDNKKQHLSKEEE